MAHGIQVIRNANAKQAAQNIGFDPRQPTTTVSQGRMKDNQADVHVLPSDLTGFLPLQCTTPGANFSKLYFIPDYSVPGGSDIPR